MERMTPEDANAEAWRWMERAMERQRDLTHLSCFQRERDYWPSGHPTAYNPLDLENEIEKAHADIAAATVRVDTLTEEVRLGLIERGDLPAD